MDIRSIVFLVHFFLACTLSSFKSGAQDQLNDANTLIDSAIKAMDTGALDKAASYNLKAIAIAKQFNAELHEAKYLINLMSIKIEQVNNIPIDIWYDRAEAILNQKGNDIERAVLWKVKARHHMYNQRFKEARAMYSKIERVLSPLKEDMIYAYFCNDMGYLEAAAGNYLEATRWYRKSISIFENIGEKIGLANTLANLSNAYLEMEEYNRALLSAHQSMSIRNDLGDKDGLTFLLGILTKVHFQLKQIDSAKFYQESYISLAKASGRKKTLADSYLHLGQILQEAKQTKQALANYRQGIYLATSIKHPKIFEFHKAAASHLLEMNDPITAAAHLDTLSQIAHKTSNSAHWSEYYQLLSKSHELNNDYKSAMEAYKLSIEYKQKVVSESVKKQVAQMELQYELQKKGTELAQLAASKAKSRLWYNIVILICCVFIFVGLLLFYRYRYQQKIAYKNHLLKERNRISAELHDEVGSALSAINLISYSGISNQNKSGIQLKQSLVIINQHAKQLMESISDLVWSMHPDNEQLERLVVRMKSFAAEVFEAVDVSFTFEYVETLTPLKMAPSLRKDLYLIFKELVNNVAKYANASKVKIVITHDENSILLHLEDNGCGFDQNKVIKGNGFDNIANRAAAHQGTAQWESKLGEGTKVRVRLWYT